MCSVLCSLIVFGIGDLEMYIWTQFTIFKVKSGNVLNIWFNAPLLIRFKNKFTWISRYYCVSPLSQSYVTSVRQYGCNKQGKERKKVSSTNLKSHGPIWRTLVDGILVECVIDVRFFPVLVGRLLVRAIDAVIDPRFAAAHPLRILLQDRLQVVNSGVIAANLLFDGQRWAAAQANLVAEFVRFRGIRRFCFAVGVLESLWVVFDRLDDSFVSIANRKENKPLW